MYCPQCGEYVENLFDGVCVDCPAAEHFATTDPEEMDRLADVPPEPEKA